MAKTLPLSYLPLKPPPERLPKAYSYDTLGLLTQATNRANDSSNLARTEQSDGYTVSYTSAENRQTTYKIAYQANGDQKRTNTTPDNLSTSIDYTADENDKVVSPNGTETSATRVPEPRWSMLAPLTGAYSMKFPSGLTFTLNTSRTVNLQNPADPLSLVSQTTTTDINGRIFKLIYNAANKEYLFTSPEGRTKVFKTDPQGRITMTASPGFPQTFINYDNKGRPSSEIIVNGTTTLATINYQFNSEGWLESVTDTLGLKMSFAYDAIGRIKKQFLPYNQQVLFGYDANSNLISLTPPGKPAHTFGYDNRDLRVSYTPPSVGTGATTVAYSYNKDQQLLQMLRADGKSISYSYDTAGRLDTMTTPRGTYQHTYSPTTGQLTQKTAPGGSNLSYSYDGSLLKSVTTAGTPGGSVGMSYDNNLRITSRSVNSAHSVAFSYDRDSLLTQVGSMLLTRESQTGRFIGTTLGQLSTSYTYDSFSIPQRYAVRYGTNTLFTQSFVKDKLRRIVQKAETIGSVTTTYDYDYDLNGRLVLVKTNGIVTAGYTYDANGNRLTEDTGNGTTITSLTTGSTMVTGRLVKGEGGKRLEAGSRGTLKRSTRSPQSVQLANTIAALATTSATYDAQDRLLTYGANTYTYTAHGELLTKTNGTQVTSYDYDVLGNLHSVTLPDGTKLEYIIDANNRRIGKKVNGSLVKGWLYKDQLNPIAELDSTGAVLSRFAYGSKPHVPDTMVRGGKTYRFVTDHLGSVRLVVDVATGAIVQRLDYDAWGKVLQDTNPGFQPFGFAGGIYDRDTGLVRFGARDYDPQVGRWTSKDPSGLSHGMNLYLYVEADPINLNDVNGLNWTHWFAWVGPYSEQISSAAAGFGDELSLNITKKVRQWGGIDGFVNYCSGAYTAGVAVGVPVGAIAFGGAATGGYRVFRFKRLMNRVRRLCPGRECQQLSDALIPLLESAGYRGGKPITIFPKTGRGTIPHRFPDRPPWAWHTAVDWGGKVLDPLLGRVWGSRKRFVKGVVGKNPVMVQLGGAVIKF